MIKPWVVYDGGRLSHLPRVNVLREVMRWRATEVNNPDHPSQHLIISDAAAQTIASWWHSPGQPYSTMLSTMGRVDRYATLDHFGTEADCESGLDKQALRALGAYLTVRQQAGEVMSRPCACHTCFDMVVGRVGELCPECEDAGCDPTDFRNENGCDRPDAFTDEDAPCDGGPDGMCDCLFCIPGA